MVLRGFREFFAFRFWLGLFWGWEGCGEFLLFMRDLRFFGGFFVLLYYFSKFLCKGS